MIIDYDDIGLEVIKSTGDYTFSGEVVAVFKKITGAKRIVVEDKRGLLFIFNESQLSPIY